MRCSRTLEPAGRIPDSQLERLSVLIADRMGLRFPRDRWHDLERGLRSAAGEFGFDDVEACAQWVLSSSPDRRHTEILAGCLTVGETYFFREPHAFDAIEQWILPELVRARERSVKRLKFWSAGCCTGEEPYSIAMLLDKLLPDIKNWRIDIIGTDINPRFLERASEGVYGEWSFRSAPPWVKQAHFKRTADGKLRLSRRIRDMVRFEYVNLAEDIYPGRLNHLYAVDVIFCRNVLMYFDARQAGKALAGFYRSLMDGGWLIAGASDLLHVRHSEFVKPDPSNPNVYRKDTQWPTSTDGDTQPAAPAALEAPRPVAAPPRTRRTRPRMVPKRPARPTHEQPGLDAAYEEALLLYNEGHYDEAAARLTGSLSNNAPRRTALNGNGKALLARILANQGELSEALAWCEQAVAADTLSSDLHYLRANILQEQGRAEEAIACMRQTLFLDPSFVVGHFALANLALAGGRLAEARKHFSNTLRLLRRCPDDALVPESGGVTAQRLTEIVESTVDRGGLG